MTTSCTDNTHPYYGKISRLSLPNAVKFFTKNPERMKHVSLGEMLDFTCGAGMNYVVWEMPVREMIGFIDTWMKNQEQRVHYKKVPLSGNSYTHEIDHTDVGYLWNRFHRDFDERLPFIKREGCSNKEHNGTGKDVAGRIHCIQKIKEYEDDREVDGICYSIIDDSGIYLPLERVLTRLDVNSSFTRSESHSVFPFSGFTIAGYVKAWHNQEGEKKLFMNPGEIEDFRLYSDFHPVNSED